MRKRIKKWGALLCAAVMLLVSVPSIPVQASSLGDVDIDYTQVDLKKICDIILTKQGIVARSEVLEEVVGDYVTGFKDGLTDLVDILTFTDTDACDRDTFSSNLDAAGITGYQKDVYLNAYDLYCTDGTYSWLNKAENFGDYVTHGLQRYLVDDGVTKGNTYTVDEDVVQDICNTFQTWWSDNGSYILVEVVCIKDRLTTCSFFNNDTAYNNALLMYENLNTDNIYWGYWTSDYVSVVTVSDFNLVLGNNGIVDNGEYDSIYFDLYTVGLSPRKFYYKSCYFSSCTDIDSAYYVSNEVTSALRMCKVGTFDMASGAYFFSANGGEKVRIWHTLDGLQNFTLGSQNVYYTSTYTTTSYNTVTYTGDYYCDTSSYYNYSSVQTNIDNSTESNITDSIVDSIVDNSVTTIINNYTYVTGSGDGSGGDINVDGDYIVSGGDAGGSSGDDADDDEGFFDRVLNSLGDLLGKVLGLLEEVIDIVLSFLIDALGVLVTGLTDALAKLSELMAQVSGIQGFLTAFFSFMPGEYWSIVTSTMLIICVLAIVRFFKK